MKIHWVVAVPSKCCLRISLLTWLEMFLYTLSSSCELRWLFGGFSPWCFINPVCSLSLNRHGRSSLCLRQCGKVGLHSLQNTSSTSLFYFTAHAGQTRHDREWYIVTQIKLPYFTLYWVWLVHYPFNIFLLFSVTCKSMQGPVFVKWTQNYLRSKAWLVFWKSQEFLMFFSS